MRRKIMMRVGIAGAGAIAMGYAAFLSGNGHAVSLWSPSGNGTKELREGKALHISGEIEGDFHPQVAEGAVELAKCDVIVVALPAYGYRSVLDELADHLEARHTVVISAHLSFAALYLAKRLSERGLQIPIAVWNTTVLTAKAQSRLHVRVGAIRSKVDIAVVPVRIADSTYKLCVQRFGERFLLKDDLLTIALSNLNPQNHMGIALCNLTRIERGEAWGQNSNMTPVVARLLERLDQERIAIATAFGKTVRTIFDHSVLSHGVSGDSVAGIYFNLAASGKDPQGPRDIDTRYVLEDVPFGLVPMLRLAGISGASARLHECGVELLQACYGRDFAAENDILDALGPLDRDRLGRLVVRLFCRFFDSRQPRRGAPQLGRGSTSEMNVSTGRLNHARFAPWGHLFSVSSIWISRRRLALSRPGGKCNVDQPLQPGIAGAVAGLGGHALDDCPVEARQRVGIGFRRQFAILDRAVKASFQGLHRHLAQCCGHPRDRRIFFRMLQHGRRDHAASRLVRLGVTISNIVEVEAQGLADRKIGLQYFRPAAVFTGNAEV
jgi:opine dehydrogenase